MAGISEKTTQSELPVPRWCSCPRLQATQSQPQLEPPSLMARLGPNSAQTKRLSIGLSVYELSDYVDLKLTFLRKLPQRWGKLRSFISLRMASRDQVDALLAVASCVTLRLLGIQDFPALSTGLTPEDNFATTGARALTASAFDHSGSVVFAV